MKDAIEIYGHIRFVPLTFRQHWRHPHPRGAGGPAGRHCCGRAGSRWWTLVARAWPLAGRSGGRRDAACGAIGRNPIEQKSTGPNLRSQDQGDIGNHLLIGGLGLAFPTKRACGPGHYVEDTMHDLRALQKYFFQTDEVVLGLALASTPSP